MSLLLFEEMKSYVGFTDEDADRLQSLGERVTGELEGIVREFYDRIDDTPAARAVVQAHSSRKKLERTLVQWMREFFTPPYDLAYYERRARIGHVHVRIGLPPHFVFTAMNVLRLGLLKFTESHEHPPVHKLMDIELAIINQVYWEAISDNMRRVERMATIGGLAGSFAHEVRNPLTAIQNAAFLLKSGGVPNPRSARALEILDDKVRVCAQLVNSLLEFSRIAGPVLVDISPHALVSQVIADVERPGGVVVHYEVDEGLQSMRGDELQLSAALRNLLTNAIQALGVEGQVTVRARSTGDVIQLEVSDNGPGIPEDTVHTIFNPLVTTKTYGLGLGLPYCRRVAEAHGGKLSLSQTPGGGATFTIEVPR